MADFCKECSIELFGKDLQELAQLLPKENYDDFNGAGAICEGCGYITVNYEGECRSASCPRHGMRNLQLLNDASRRIEDERVKRSG